MVKKIFLTFVLLLCFSFFTSHVNADETTTYDETPYFNCSSSTIYKSSTGILTLSEVKDLVLTYITYDDTLSLSIEMIKDTYTGNGATPGEYDIYYKIYYSNEGYTNYSTVSLKVKVIDSFAGDYYFNNWLYTRQALSKEQLLKTLQACGEIPNVDLNIVFTSQYFELTDEEKLNKGIYYGSYSYSSTTGYSADGTFKISVLDGLNSDIIYTAPAVNYGLIIGIISSVLILGIVIFIVILMKRKFNYKKQ